MLTVDMRLLLLFIASLLSIGNATPGVPCSATYLQYGATSETYAYSDAYAACLSISQFVGNVFDETAAAGIISNMSTCFIGGYIYLWAFKFLVPPESGQCWVINLSTQTIELLADGSCVVPRPFICVNDEALGVASNLFVSTVTTVFETTPTFSVTSLTTQLSTVVSVQTTVLSVDSTTTSFTTTYTTTVPSDTTVISTEVLVQPVSTEITLTSTSFSTTIVGSTTITKEIVYLITTTTDILVPGSTTTTSTRTNVVSTVPVTRTVSRCPSSCPTQELRVCSRDRDRGFVVVENELTLEQAECACQKINGVLGSPGHNDTRYALRALRRCTGCGPQSYAWIRSPSDNLCTVLSLKGEVVYVPCDSKHRVLCMVQSRHNTCNGKVEMEVSTSGQDNEYAQGGKNDQYQRDSSKIHPPLPLYTKNSKTAYSYTVCPFNVANIYMLTNVIYDGPVDNNALCAEAIVGGTFLKMLNTQSVPIDFLMTMCSTSNAWVSSYNTASAIYCMFYAQSGTVTYLTDISLCSLSRGVLCYQGINPDQTISTISVSTSFTLATTLTTETVVESVVSTVEETTLTTSFDITKTITAMFPPITTDLTEGVSSVTSTTTSFSTEVITTETTVETPTSVIDIDNVTTSTFSPIGTVTSTNYLGTTTTTTTVVVIH